MPNVRACRVCGCTDADCTQCIRTTGSPCSWVAADLCSACVAPRSTLEAFHALPAHAETPNHEVLAVIESGWLPTQSPIGKVRITAVLLSGRIGDYCAYVGVGTTEWVANQGNKLPLAVASILFPGIEERRYRP